LKNKKTKLILYTYDSFLFDYSLDEGKDIIIDLYNIITVNGNYTVHLKAGINYKDMKTFALKL